jgi:hypothetical protein
LSFIISENLAHGFRWFIVLHAADKSKNKQLSPSISDSFPLFWMEFKKILASTSFTCLNWFAWILSFLCNRRNKVFMKKIPWNICLIFSGSLYYYLATENYYTVLYSDKVLRSWGMDIECSNTQNEYWVRLLNYFATPQASKIISFDSLQH